MIDERQEQQAALYALDLLEGQERAAFEAELARHPALRRLVEDLRATSAQLAYTADSPAPSPGLRDRILASIDSVPAGAFRPAAKTPSVTEPLRPKQSGRYFWLMSGLAASFAIGALVYSMRYHSAAGQLEQARADLDATRTDLASARDKIDEDNARLIALESRLDREGRLASAQLAALESALRQAGELGRVSLTRLARTDSIHPDAQALALWDPGRKQGLLTLENLPMPGADEDYQLWMIIPGEAAPISLGVFLVEPSGVSRIPFKLDRAIGADAKIAISREPKGGSTAPRGPVIALGPI